MLVCGILISELIVLYRNQVGCWDFDLRIQIQMDNQISLWDLCTVKLLN